MGAASDVIGCVGRDPFAEEDGGTPLEPGRVVNGATVPGSMARTNVCAAGAANTGSRGRKEGEAPPSRGLAGSAQRRPAVSVLEDLWKLDLRTLLWERVSDASCLLRGNGWDVTYAQLHALWSWRMHLSFSPLGSGGQGFG